MKLLLLAISKKYGGLCVAGIDYDTLKYVRIGHRNGKECGPLQPFELNIDGYQCQILDVINVDVSKMDNNGCQVENYNLIRINSFVKRIKYFEIDKFYHSLKHYDFVFLNNRYTLLPYEINYVNYSLCLVKVKDLNIYMSPNSRQHDAPYASFIYNGHKYYGLSVTDSLVCAFPRPYTLYENGKLKNAHLGKHQEAYIMVSLPYDEWSIEKGFFKYVSGVIVC